VRQNYTGIRLWVKVSRGSMFAHDVRGMLHHSFCMTIIVFGSWGKQGVPRMRLCRPRRSVENSNPCEGGRATMRWLSMPTARKDRRSTLRGNCVSLEREDRVRSRLLLNCEFRRSASNLDIRTETAELYRISLAVNLDADVDVPGRFARLCRSWPLSYQTEPRGPFVDSGLPER
jgi:hypothetical protein